MFEELVGNGEELEPAGIDKIFRVRETPGFDRERLAEQIGALIGAATVGRTQEVLQQLRQIVPTFSPEVTRSHEVPVPDESAQEGSHHGILVPLNSMPAFSDIAPSR